MLSIIQHRVQLLRVMLILVIFIDITKPGACPEANFPIQVGGPKAESKINVMDYHESTKRFALGGFTACRDLKRNNGGTAGKIPLIMSYVPDTNGKIQSPDWGYTLALSGWSFYQIAISQDGEQIVGLVYANTLTSYLFFIKSDASKMNLQKINPGVIFSINVYFKNILVGSSSSNLFKTNIVGRINIGGTIRGFVFSRFTLNTSSGQYSVAYDWGIQSTDVSADAQVAGIVYGLDQQEIFMVHLQQSRTLISYLNICAIDQLSVTSSSQIVAAICGDDSGTKFLVVLDVPNKGLPPTPGALKHNDLDAITSNMDIMGMMIVNQTQILTLLYDRPIDIIKLAQYKLDEMKIYFQQVFMRITANSPSFKYIRGIFVDKNIYYLGFTGTQFFTLPGSNAPDFTHGFHTSFILSSNDEDSCYRQWNIPPIQMTLQSVPNLVFTYATAVFKLNVAITITKDMTKIEQIDDGKLVKKDSWCKQNPYDVVSVVYPTTLYTFPVGSTFIQALSSSFSANQICDISAPLAFTYSISYPIQNPLPSVTYLSNFAIDPSTGEITVSSSTPVGSYKVRVLGVLPNGQFYQEIFTFKGQILSSYYFSPALVDIKQPHNQVLNAITIPTLICSIACTPLAFSVMVTTSVSPPLLSTFDPSKITNSAPQYDVGLTDQRVGVGETFYYELPQIFDAEGDTVTRTDSFPLFASASLCPGSINKCVKIYPNLLSYSPNSYPLSIKLDDGNLNTVYDFTVQVYNEPPIFSTPPTAVLTVRLNDNFVYFLPPYSDPQNNPITVTINSMNALVFSFVSVAPNNLSIIINPVNFRLYNTDRGIYMITIRLSDGQLFNDYKMQIKITNSLPKFIRNIQPRDLKIALNDKTNYRLPQSQDEEGHTVSVVILSMPQWIKYEDSMYLFSPTDPTKDLGIFTIKGALTDNVTKGQYTEFSFKVIVKNQPPYFKEKLVNQKLSVGKSFFYNLPQMEDREKLNIFSNALYNGGSQLPSFMNFTGTSFIFKPFYPSDIGVYIVTILLGDGFCAPRFYSLVITVAKGQPPPTKQNSDRNKAQIRITKVNRDSTVEMKILIPKNSQIPPGFRLNITDVNATQIFRGLEFSIEDKQNIKIIQNKTTWKNETQTLIIKLNISRPSEISNGVSFDNLVLSVQEDLIISTLNISSKTKEIYLPGNFQTQNSIPPQASYFMSSFADSFKNGMNILQIAMIPGTIFLNLFLAILIQYLWGLLNDLSFLTILTLVSICTPGIAQVIQSSILNFIYMDILMTDKWFVNFFYSDKYSEQNNDDVRQRNLLEDESNLIQTEDEDNEDTPLNSYFDQNGFSSKSFVKNLGSTFIFLLIYLLGFIVLIVAILINRISQKNTKSEAQQNHQASIPKKPKNYCQKFEQWIRSQLMWNSTLRFIFQQYPNLFISGLINCYDLQFKFPSDIISSSIAIIIVILVHSAAFLTIRILFKNRQIIRYNKKDQKKLKRKKELKIFISKYGTIIENLSIKTDIGLYWNSLVLIRWTLTIIILVCLRNYVQFQIMTLLMLTFLFQTLLVLGKPNLEPLENKISFFNEMMVCLYLYQLISLTDYPTEPIPSREAIGWGLIITVMTSVIVNLIKFFYLITKSLRYRCRKKKYEQYLRGKEERECARRKREQYLEEVKSEMPLQNNIDEDRFPHIMLKQKPDNENIELKVKKNFIDVQFKNGRIQQLDKINDILANKTEQFLFKLDNNQYQYRLTERTCNTQNLPFNNYPEQSQNLDKIKIKDAFDKSLINNSTDDYQYEQNFKERANNLEDLLSKMQKKDQNLHQMNQKYQPNNYNYIEAFNKPEVNKTPQSISLQNYNSLIQEIIYNTNKQIEEEKFDSRGLRNVKEYSNNKRNLFK